MLCSSLSVSESMSLNFPVALSSSIAGSRSVFRGRTRSSRGHTLGIQRQIAYGRRVRRILRQRASIEVEVVGGSEDKDALADREWIKHARSSRQQWGAHIPAVSMLLYAHAAAGPE